ncbi:MAG: RND family transporter [Candidatus Thermoplasmatota archaeon]|nr:RND family transporter [Candidatus Thermoplasmatota archaeon]
MSKKIKREGKRRYSELFSRAIGGNPKKVIAVVIIFTLIMGFLASSMDMNTSEESFQPDIPKQDYMSTVQEQFGSAEEVVQIAFTAEDGDVFTVQVLEDMLEMEEALQEDPKVNFTLSGTDEVPSGVTTLASTILTANRTLELEADVIDLSQQTLSLSENQTKMYERMNMSLTLNLGITHIFEENMSIAGPEGALGGNRTLISMSDIVSNPESWIAMETFKGEFTELIGILDPNSTDEPDEPDEPLENVSANIGEWVDGVQQNRTQMENDTPGMDHFLELVQGTRDMVNASIRMVENETIDFQEEKNLPRMMTLTFLATAEPMGYLKDSRESDLGSMGEKTPSLGLSLEEKKDNLSEMTDTSVKRTVADTIDHDPSDLNESIKEAMNITDEAEKGIEHLKNMEELLTTAIQQYRNISWNWQANRLEEGYLASVKENQTIMNEAKKNYTELKTMLRSSLRLNSMIDQIGEMIKTIVSKDFSPTGELHSIEAKCSLGMAFMDPNIDEDKRLEAQKRVIELGGEVPENSKVRVSANQVMMEEIDKSADRSLNTLLPLAVVLIIVILFIVFRSPLETFLSLASLAIAVIWTFGFGVFLGYEFNPMIIAVPILITGLVIDYGIHMVMRYREEKEDGYRPRGATMIAIMTVGGALVLTTFTTAVGFLSNTLSNIQAMREFGVLAALGIISSFFLMTTFLPAVIQLIDERKEKGKEEESRSKRKLADKATKHGSDVISRMLSTSADASDKHPVVILSVVGLITLSSLYGVVNIDSTFAIEDFLPEDEPQSENIKYISSNFDITTSYAYILTEGDLASSDYLEAVDNTTKNIKDSKMVGGNGGDVKSPLSVLQNYGTAPPGSPDHNPKLVQAFSENDTDGDDIPERNIKGLYDMLFSYNQSRGSIRGVLNRTSSGGYTTGIIRLSEDQEKISSDLDNAAVLEEELKEDVEPLKESDFTAKVTSGSMIGQETTSELTATQIKSLIATIAIVALTLTIIFYYLHRSLFLGVITAAPVAVITLWIIATMYLLDVPLNVLTVTITALTVGMGVDYSIHITHRFTEEIDDNDLFEAMHETVQNTGAALFGSATSTVAAFGILSTSDILPIAQFGYITALALVYSFFVAVFVLPSALMVWAKQVNPD